MWYTKCKIEALKTSWKQKTGDLDVMKVLTWGNSSTEQPQKRILALIVKRVQKTFFSRISVAAIILVAQKDYGLIGLIQILLLNSQRWNFDLRYKAWEKILYAYKCYSHSWRNLFLKKF